MTSSSGSRKPEAPEQIRDDDVLYRRLARHQINPDGTVNSSAFKRGGAFETEISVDLARLTDPQTSVDRAGRVGFRLGAFEAIHPKNLGFRVEYDPLVGNPAHTLIRGHNDQEISRALARRVRLVEAIESRDRPQTIETSRE
ncbi:MAG TPA: hypothetical protein VH482_33760 [Thermomicrobiales bacterium]